MLHELARGVDGELVVAVYGENPQDRRPIKSQVRRFAVGDVAGMVAAAMTFEDVPHANVYVPLHVVRRGLGDGARGKTSDIVAVLGLVADMDADTGRVGKMPFEPSLVIETSPGNSQPVVLFDRPLSPAEAKPLAESLKIATKSDSGTADIAHVWRVPGTRNWPNATKLARGRDATSAPVRVVKAWDGTLQSPKAIAEALHPWRAAPRAEPPRVEDEHADGSDLPARLFELIREGVETGKRSSEFMHVVGWLKDLKFTPDAIEELLAAHPTGIAGKYDSESRLRQEIDRCYWKARSRSADTFAEVQGVGEPAAESLLLWYGDEPPQPPPWLVRNTLPETGVALLAGQYATGKTFVGADLAGSVLTGLDFMGQEVCRRGGVLWLAAEGEAEVEARLWGVINGKLRGTLDDETDLEHLAFARQKFDVPSLTAKDAQTRLAQLAAAASEGMQIRDVPLALIVIDTLAAAAGFEDENSASETQKVMGVLKCLSRSTGALVVAIDHYGKTVETGPRGSTAKGAAADAILAVLADKDSEGQAKNRRLAITKLRSGPAGRVVPFELHQLPIKDISETTCFVEWRQDDGKATKNEKQSLPGRTRILKCSMESTLLTFPETILPFGEESPAVSAVDRDRVRNEFYASLSGTIGSKRKAFKRAQDDATGRGLIMCREIRGRDMLWFRNDGPGRPAAGQTGQPLRGLSCPSGR